MKTVNEILAAIPIRQGQTGSGSTTLKSESNDLKHSSRSIDGISPVDSLTTHSREDGMGISLDDVYESKWLRAKDLGEKPRLMTIREIGTTKFKDGKTQITLTFDETDKPFGCNKTNASNIAKILASRDTDDWIGRQIVLYPTEVEFSGDLVPAIRIRAPKKTAPPPRRPNPIPEEIPYDDPEDPGTDTIDDDIPF